MSFGDLLTVETKAGLTSVSLSSSQPHFLSFYSSAQSSSLLLHHSPSSISETTFLLDIGFALRSTVFCFIFVLDWFCSHIHEYRQEHQKM